MGPYIIHVHRMFPSNKHPFWGGSHLWNPLDGIIQGWTQMTQQCCPAAVPASHAGALSCQAQADDDDDDDDDDDYDDDDDDDGGDDDGGDEWCC